MLGEAGRAKREIDLLKRDCRLLQRKVPKEHPVFELVEEVGLVAIELQRLSESAVDLRDVIHLTSQVRRLRDAIALLTNENVSSDAAEPSIRTAIEAALNF